MNSQQRRKARRITEIFASLNITVVLRFPPELMVGSYINKIRNYGVRKAVKTWLQNKRVSKSI